MRKKQGAGMRVRCRRCGDVIQSPEVGQLVSCTCGAVKVDALVDEPDGLTRVLGRPEDREQVPADQQMHIPTHSAAVEALFQATPEQLGQAAIRGVSRRRTKAEADELRRVIQKIDPSWNGQSPEPPVPTELSPKDQAALAESLLNPPPIGDAMQRAWPESLPLRRN